MSVKTNEQLAKIAIAKNLIKEYTTNDSERTVYLENGTEFQIYIKNPRSEHLGIKIYINEQYIGNMLVLRPGESIWLERFLDTNRKFMFSTYSVENSLENQYAISKNGKVRIEFFREEYRHKLSISDFPYDLYDDCHYKTALNNSTNYYDCGHPISISSNVCNNVLLNLDSFSDKGNMDTFCCNTIETGRVEKGSESKQKFTECDIDFSSFPFSTENIQILPSSRKNFTKEDTYRKYCSNCGKKVSPKDKYCSNCGKKLK